MEKFILVAMLLLIFGTASMYVFGRLIYMGVRRVFAPVYHFIRKYIPKQLQDEDFFGNCEDCGEDLTENESATGDLCESCRETTLANAIASDEIAPKHPFFDSDSI